VSSNTIIISDFLGYVIYFCLVWQVVSFGKSLTTKALFRFRVENASAFLFISRTANTTGYKYKYGRAKIAHASCFVCKYYEMRAQTRGSPVVIVFVGGGATAGVSWVANY
jgi:hypothetical protein